MRKVMSHSFTGKALKAQEPILASYVSLFVSRLREKATSPKPKGQGTVVDIVGDLFFGEPFDCLRHDALPVSSPIVASLALTRSLESLTCHNVTELQ